MENYCTWLNYRSHLFLFTNSWYATILIATEMTRFYIHIRITLARNRVLLYLIYIFNNSVTNKLPTQKSTSRKFKQNPNIS